MRSTYVLQGYPRGGFLFNTIYTTHELSTRLSWFCAHCFFHRASSTGSLHRCCGVSTWSFLFTLCPQCMNRAHVNCDRMVVLDLRGFVHYTLNWVYFKRLCFLCIKFIVDFFLCSIHAGGMVILHGVEHIFRGSSIIMLDPMSSWGRAMLDP